MAAWDRLARDLDVRALDAIGQEIALPDAIAAASQLLDGKVRGRIVVDVNR
jgi:acrylyl-CoA reductase (NADPH)